MLGGIRKLIQDLVAPEMSGLKATLTAIVDGQRLIREDVRENIRALESRLSADIQAAREEVKASEARLVSRIETGETKLIDRIEQSKHEIMLAVENRFLRDENEQLKKRLELPTQ